MTGRAWFCVSGVATYNGARNLTDVRAELTSVRTALAGLGAEELFPFTAEELEAGERAHHTLSGHLRTWAGERVGADSGGDDTLVVYLTGHGTVADGGGVFRLVDRTGTNPFDPAELPGPWSDDPACASWW